MTFDEFIQYIKNSEPAKDCPVSKTLALMSGKWTSRVIYELEKQETIRFGELKSKINGITNTMLSSTLKNLEEKNIVIRVQFNVIPPHVEYSLSGSGKAMIHIYYEIAKWGSQYL
jgi:DNA-binding HxlR family transcriptional regulator